MGDTDWDAVFLDEFSDGDGEQTVDANIDPAVPDTDAGMDLDPADFLESGLPLEDVADLAADLACGAELSAPRKRGRPVGTCGTKLLRQQQKAAQAELQRRAEASRPQPGSIEYARECKKMRKSQSTPGCADDMEEAMPGRSSIVSVMEPRSSMWTFLLDIQAPLHQSLVAAAQFSMLHQEADAREKSETATLMSLKAAAIMSDKALKSAMTSQGHSDTLRVERLTTRAACACVLAGGAAWGAVLKAIAEQDSKWRAILFVEKVRYDETPLRVRVEGQQSSGSKAGSLEACQHAKVFQAEMTVQMVLQEKSSGRRLLFAGCQPTVLQTMDRTTAECCLKALCNVRALIPGIETVSSLFENYLRVAVPLPLHY